MFSYLGDGGHCVGAPEGHCVGGKGAPRGHTFGLQGPQWDVYQGREAFRPPPSETHKCKLLIARWLRANYRLRWLMMPEACGASSPCLLGPVAPRGRPCSVQRCISERSVSVNKNMFLFMPSLSVPRSVLICGCSNLVADDLA